MSTVGHKYGRNIYRKVQKSTQSINTQRLLTAENLAWLSDTFHTHNWLIDMANSASCFNRFRRTLSALTSEEQFLLLSLTMRFKHLPMSTYLDLMVPLLQNLKNDYPNDYIYFVRCIKEEDTRYYDRDFRKAISLGSFSHIPISGFLIPTFSYASSSAFRLWAESVLAYISVVSTET